MLCYPRYISSFNNSGDSLIAFDCVFKCFERLLEVPQELFVRSKLLFELAGKNKSFCLTFKSISNLLGCLIGCIFEHSNKQHISSLTKVELYYDDRNLVDPASSHTLLSKIKPCMSKYKHLYRETANGSLNRL